MGHPGTLRVVMVLSGDWYARNAEGVFGLGFGVWVEVFNCGRELGYVDQR